MLRTLPAGLLALLLLPLPASGLTVSTVDRDAVEVDALALDEGRVVGGPLDGTSALDLVQVIGRTASPPVPGALEVRLAAGDILWGRLKTGAEEGMSLETSCLGSLAITLSQLATLVNPGKMAGPAFAALQERIASDRAGMDRDFCYLTSGDRVRFYVRAVDAAGVRGEDDAGQPLAFPMDQVAAVSFVSTAPVLDATGVRTRVALDDGAVVLGELKSIRDGEVVLLHAVLGVLRVPLARCAQLEILNGRVVALSDLTPSSVVERPFLFDPARPAAEATVFRHRRDRQVVDGRPLSIRGRTYAKGLGAHAFSEIEYALDGAFERFRSDVGIDDSAAGGGDAEVVVKVDGKERFRARVGGRDAAGRVDVDCRGARRMTLTVDFGGDGEILDRVAWGGAVLVRNAP